MDFALPELADHGAMETRAVSLVRIKSVLRVFFVRARHNPVARDFGDDGCGADHRYFFITFDNCLLIDMRGKKKSAVQ